MPRRDRFGGRFESDDEGPLASMANLVDVMLVFACGLIAALILGKLEASQVAPQQMQNVERGKELPRMPDAMGQQGSGMQSVGRVYKDPKTGKLILVGDPAEDGKLRPKRD